MPKLAGASKASVAFYVKYEDGRATVPDGDFRFTYRAGGVAISSAYDWLVVGGDAWAHIPGSGLVDGSTKPFPMRSVRASTPGGPVGRMVMGVWAPEADPDRDAPVCRASGDVTGRIGIPPMKGPLRLAHGRSHLAGPDRSRGAAPCLCRAHRASLRPWSAGGGYVNHLGDEKHDRVHEAYGSDT